MWLGNGPKKKKKYAPRQAEGIDFCFFSWCCEPARPGGAGGRVAERWAIGSQGGV